MCLRTVTVTAIVTAIGMLVLGLAGCTSDDPPTTDPPPRPTTSAPVPSPTPTDLSVAPPGETARAFIRRWVALGDQMQATGDTAAFLAVAGPDCDSCRKFASRVARIYDAGGRIDGGSERIVSLKRESRTQFVLTVSAAPTEYVESADGPRKELPGGTYRSRLYLADPGGRWLVGATVGLPS